MRKLFESIQPNNRVRKTLYCMLRLCLGARVEEIFWLLTGNGRNGKGVVMLWMEHLQSKALFSTMPICALTVPLDGEGPSPELRKAHRRRILNFTEPPEEDDDEGGLRTHKKGLRAYCQMSRFSPESRRSRPGNVDQMTQTALSGPPQFYSATLARRLLGKSTKPYWSELSRLTFRTPA